jgi:hypothetical protein
MIVESDQELYQEVGLELKKTIEKGSKGTREGLPRYI